MGNNLEENTQPEDKDDHGAVFFQWRFLEFTPYQRGQGWYVAAAIIAVLLLTLSIWTANFLFAIIIVIFSLIIILFQRQGGEIEFQITEDGIMIGKRFYDYNELKNFYIIYQPPEVKTLYFEPKSLIQPRLPIFLQDHDPVAIREVLLKYLPEDLEKEHEPLSDQISRLFKL